MASHLLGLLGRKRSGKDTFASFLVEDHGFTRLAFADALKDTAIAINPTVNAYWRDSHGSRWYLSELVDSFGWEGAKEYPDVRRFLQTLGMAVRDNVSAEAWTNVVYEKVSKIAGPVVLTDVRMPNELSMVTGHPRGYAVRIVRPGLSQDDTHISETALDEYSAFEIDNDSDVAALKGKAERVVRTLGA